MLRDGQAFPIVDRKVREIGYRLLAPAVKASEVSASKIIGAPRLWDDTPASIRLASVAPARTAKWPMATENFMQLCKCCDSVGLHRWLFSQT